MPHWKRLGTILGIISASIACDQLTKRLAFEYLRDQPVMSYFADTFRFQYSENNAAFLSLGHNLSDAWRFWVFTVLVTAFLGAMAVYLIVKRQLSQSEIVAYSLILSGGIGNLIDRIGRDGLVIDFMNMGIGSLRTGIFNVADMAIMLGMFILLTRRSKPENPIGELGVSKT